jgi:flagellar biosynthesis/type III secretory pathway M-ring protein FliF/YscJ
MTAFITLSLILILAILIVRWIAAVPLMRTLTASIDSWADAVQGQDAETTR